MERSKIALERKKLEAEVERLRRETEQLERHQQQLRNSCQQQQQQLSDTSSSSMDSSSSSSSGGERTSTMQSELQLRKANLRRVGPTTDTSNCLPQNLRVNDPVTSSLSAPTKVLPNVVKNDQHDRLIEEFRKVHREMFKSAEAVSSSEDVEEESDDIGLEVKTHEGQMSLNIVASPPDSTKVGGSL